MSHWKKHTALSADSCQTICGLVREPAFLKVPASDGVTCIVCLQGVARAYSEAAHHNLKDAIANRERADKAEAELATLRADLARVTAEVEMLRGVGCDEDGDGPCGACLKCARRERDAARAQVRELLKVARAAVALRKTGKRAIDDPRGVLEEHAIDAVVDVFRAVDALPPSMLEDPSDG